MKQTAIGLRRLLFCKSPEKKKFKEAGLKLVTLRQVTSSSNIECFGSGSWTDRRDPEVVSVTIS